ncbi:hypothetical protein EG829_25780 [bacterium]|nr:hypothetical protein [bacterium]
MTVSETVKECIGAEGRANILATSDRSGRVNLAMFGSFQLADDSSVIVMLGDNRSYSNLKENPHAACLVMLNGKTGLATEGCRLYLKVLAMEDEGEKWTQVREKVRSRIGAAADMLRHLVSFEVVEARPVLDFGQGI